MSSNWSFLCSLPCPLPPHSVVLMLFVQLLPVLTTPTPSSFLNFVFFLCSPPWILFWTLNTILHLQLVSPPLISSTASHSEQTRNQDLGQGNAVQQLSACLLSTRPGFNPHHCKNQNYVLHKYGVGVLLRISKT